LNIYKNNKDSGIKANLQWHLIIIGKILLLILKIIF